MEEEEERPGSPGQEEDGSFEIDVEAEKEKGRSRWDSEGDKEAVTHPEEEQEEIQEQEEEQEATFPSSPTSCPATPEALPAGLKTPPPSTSGARQGGARAQRRSRSLDTGRPGSPEAPCPICLGEVENRSMTDSCLHKFCFTCLQEWSKVKAECPLCKGKFSSILYNFRSATEFDTHTLPPPSPRAEAGLQEYLFSSRRFRYHTTMTTDRHERRRQFLDAQVARMGDQGLVMPAQPFR